MFSLPWQNRRDVLALGAWPGGWPVSPLLSRAAAEERECGTDGHDRQRRRLGHEGRVIGAPELDERPPECFIDFGVKEHALFFAGWERIRRDFLCNIIECSGESNIISYGSVKVDILIETKKPCRVIYSRICRVNGLGRSG